MNGKSALAGIGRALPKHLIALALAFLALPCLLSAQTLLHRYSFQTNADDSVGGPAWTGTLVPPTGGTAATINNGLTLPGGGTAGFSGYLSLPNGILTATTNLTIEVWATQNSPQQWGSIWCFDNSTSQNFQLCPDPNRNNADMIVENDPNNDEIDCATPISFPNGTEEYVAVTYNNSTLVENLYYNGALDGIFDAPNTSYCPGSYGGATGTTQNWLGRDTYNDNQFQGTVYELRIWNGVVSQRYLGASALLGPGTLVTNLTPTSVTVTAGPSVILTGTEQPSVTVELPQTGTTNVVATGDATNWVSSNPSVLAVNSNGVVTGVSLGSATISATVAGVTGTSGSITVTGPQTLLHRYSFVTDATDSVGGANGTLVTGTSGSTASIANGLSLPGNTTGGYGYSGYLSLPSGILTNTTSITVEVWATQNQGNGWAELWDFGNNGSQNFGLIPFPQNNGTHMEVAFTPNGGEHDLQSALEFPNGSEQYVCLTYNNFSLAGNLYTNGALVATTTLPNITYCPGTIGGAGGTTENSLGNDVYGDFQFDGTVYEFRIWNGAQSAAYAAVAAAAGPSVVVTNLTPLSLSVTVTNTSMIGAQTQPATVTGNFNQASDVVVTDSATNWVSSNPAILTVDSTGLITAVSGGSATVSATVNGVTATSPSITVATTAPNITQAPVNVYVLLGQSANFSVQALGGELTYQWSFDSNPILNATNATLTISDVAPANVGTYSVVVSNNMGTASASATLTIVQEVLQHRYSFISNAVDSVGGPTWNGTLVPATSGTAATINNGLSLPGNAGGGFGVSGYVSLPKGILTNTTSITVECWLTQNQQNTWAEAWDFGSSGSLNFALIPYPANNNNDMEVAFTPHGNEIDLQSTLSFPSGSEQYVAVTFNSGTLVGNLYTNGALLATHTYPDATYTPGTIDLVDGGTSENMLGNDVYGDEQFSGTIYEFRIWDGAVSPLYLAVAAAAGPSVVVTNLTPLSLDVTVTNSAMIQGQTQPATVIGNFADASGINVTAGATNWMSSNVGVLTVDANGNVTAVGTGSATISATVNGTTGTSASIAVVTSAPVITVEPNTNETLLVGGTLSATLANIGTTPFTYFWFTNGSTTPIHISSTPSLTVADLQLGNAATYYCVVSNQYGTELSSNLVLAVVAPSAYEQVLLDLNPLALWPLNETSGTIAYDVIGGYNGTYTDTYSLGQSGPTNAFFDGSLAAQFTGSGYVDVPEGPFNITGPITVVSWVDMLAQNGFDGLIGHGDQSWRISVATPANTPQANDGAPPADAVSSVNITNGGWHMIAYTYSGNPSQPNNGLLYVDGVLVASNSVTPAPAGDNLDVWIGGAPDYGTTRLIAANIADAAVFTRALSPAQIQGVYSATFVVNQPPPPTITHVSLAAGNIIITGTNNAGPGGTYHLLTSTNVSLPLIDWTAVTSGSFDGNGNVNSTNAINPATPHSFFILEAP